MTDTDKSDDKSSYSDDDADSEKSDKNKTGDKDSESSDDNKISETDSESSDEDKTSDTDEENSDKADSDADKTDEETGEAVKSTEDMEETLAEETVAETEAALEETVPVETTAAAETLAQETVKKTEYLTMEDIEGLWSIDDITSYRFTKSGTGALVLPEHSYSFDYKLEEDILEIDFEKSNLRDSTFKVSVVEGVMNLRCLDEYFENEYELQKAED